MKEELLVIKDLMDELVDKMQYSEEDFSERLGRKKPEIEMVKVEGKLDPESEEPMDEVELDVESEEPMDGDMELEPESPDDKLKKRLMSLRK